MAAESPVVIRVSESYSGSWLTRSSRALLIAVAVAESMADESTTMIILEAVPGCFGTSTRPGGGAVGPAAISEADGSGERDGEVIVAEVVAPFVELGLALIFGSAAGPRRRNAAAMTMRTAGTPTATAFRVPGVE